MGSMLSKSNMNKLFRLQKQCLCYVCKLKSCDSLDNKLKDKQFIKFPDMIKIELCKFGHRLTNKTLPKPLKDLMDQRGRKKQHRYNTRCKSTPNVQLYQSMLFNQSFLCKSITEFNKLPMNVRSSQATSFTKKLKCHFLRI